MRHLIGVPVASAALTLLVAPVFHATPCAAEEFVGQLLAIEDVSPEVKFQDFDLIGHHGKSRALVVEDFDNDGRLDVFVTNPGEESYLARNVELVDGYEFQLVQIFFEDEDNVLSWGAQPADYDNDGDIDLYVAGGGNECTALDYLFQNQLIETGSLSFVDVTELAGIAGRPAPDGTLRPMASGNAVWGDANNDGRVDLFINGNNRFACGPAADGDGVNILWLNDGPDGEGNVTFSDVTEDVGLGIYDRASRHSFFIDYDHDNDMDIYEANFRDENVLWQNRLTEDGELAFVDVSEAMSLVGDDVRFPNPAFASCPGDLNNDGWDDLVVFQRGIDNDLDGGDCAVPFNGPFPVYMPAPDPLRSSPVEHHQIGDEPTRLWPFGDGHAVFMNRGVDPDTGEHLGFENIAAEIGLNNPYIDDNGVMGSQLGDVNGDGILDIYIGHGGQPSGNRDQFLMSDAPTDIDDPHYSDYSDFIDFPAENPGGIEMPTFPYRTHGTAIVDIDDDGMTEILVTNGGPAILPDTVREPNRVFELELDAEYSFLKIRLAGDGQLISRDAIGARVAVTANNGNDVWTVHRTLYSGTCFSASNSFDLFFALRNATSVDEVVVVWPDGEVSVNEDVQINTTITVVR